MSQRLPVTDVPQKPEPDLLRTERLWQDEACEGLIRHERARVVEILDRGRRQDQARALQYDHRFSWSESTFVRDQPRLDFQPALAADIPHPTGPRLPLY